MILLSNKSESRFCLIVTLSIYMLKIIGLAPFSPGVKTSAENSRGRSSARLFGFSKTGLAYNVLILVLLQVMGAIALPTFFSLTYPHSSSVTQAIDGVQGILCSFSTQVILISWIFRQKTCVSVMNRLLEVDRILSGMEKEPRDQKWIFVFMVIHLIFSAFIWIVARATGLLVLTSVTYWSFYTTSNLVVYCFIVEYFYVVGLLAKELERVNENLSKLEGFPGRISRRPFLNDYLAVLSFSTRGQLGRLKLLIEARTKLYEVSKDVADFFSFPILPAIGYSFFMLVYNVYYLIYTLLAPTRSSSMIPICNSLAWITISVYPITLLSISVGKAVNEAKLTGWIIHKLLAAAVRREIKAQLKQFSLQLLHEHPRFTAYGFFNLDCTMLHTMLEATAMYNVILIQFSRPEVTSSDT